MMGERIQDAMMISRATGGCLGGVSMRDDLMVSMPQPQPMQYRGEPLPVVLSLVARLQFGQVRGAIFVVMVCLRWKN